MISVDEALGLVWDNLTPLGTETVPLTHAAGRILAAPVIANLNQPPFASSAMDGYAVRRSDAAAAGAQLRLIGTSAAGSGFAGALAAGETVRIFTGAPVPPGADHILVQEEAEADGGTVTVTAVQDAARFVRPRGLDFAEGDTLLPAGTHLIGPAVALAAAANVPALTVAKRPNVALITNGDELVEPGSAPGADQILNSIPYGLAPMIEGWGAAVETYGPVPDELDALTEAAGKALQADLAVPIGGASVGEHDHMKRAFAAHGADPLFTRVRVRPGKPTWFAPGSGARGAVLGLPGNPASALAMGIVFVQKAISRLQGRPEDSALAMVTARLGTPLEANGPREHFLRADLSTDETGTRLVTPHINQDSALLSVFARAGALIRRAPNAPALDTGAAVDCILI